MLSDYYRLTEYEAYKKLFDPRSKKYTAAFGVLSPEKIYLASCATNFVLFVTNDYVFAQSVTRQLNETIGGYVYLPYFDDVLLHKHSVNNAVMRSRNVALCKILQGAKGAVVCVDSLTQLYPQKAEFGNGIFEFSTAKNFPFDTLPKKLTEIGYTRCDSVSVAGEYALRGDILDIFLPQYPNPVRVSFFDDTVESIKFFGADLAGKEQVESIDIIPLYLGSDEEALQNAEKSAAKQKLDSNGRARINTIIAESAKSGWLSPFKNQSLLYEYLPIDTVVIWDEPKLIESKLNRIYEDHSARFPRLLAAGEVLPEHFTQLVEYAELTVGYKNFKQISLQQIPVQTSIFQPEEIVKFKSTPLFAYRYEIERLALDIRTWLKNGYDIVICGGDNDVSERIQEHLHFYGTAVALGTKENCSPEQGVIIPLEIERGFVSHTNKLAVIGTKDLVHKSSQTKITKTKQQVFLTPSAGEYVVHEQHGIGMCLGIQNITGGWGTKDFIVVEYRDGDRLYVPVEASNLLSRFAGSDSAPRLSKIGGAEFERIKAKVKAGIKEMSVDLLKLYAEREHKRGFTYKIDGYLCGEFESSFEFIETPDQLRSIAEIDLDLTKDKIMDRLLVGDVGYGKTEVALRTAFKVIANGFQAALMAPTTILAQQHYETAKERMKSFELRVECLNRFRTAAEQKEILKKLAKGEIDLIIGTHRLLSKDVKFNKLGLLILDEEQRFGVEHKEKLKEIKTNIDVLTLSATPIPRTLHMALTGMRDISTISTPPKARLPIETFVVEESDVMIRDIIIREISRGGQIFLVYNRVETIERYASKIRKLVPNADVIVAHGQMDSALLEKSVYDFAKGKHNVLICTTIIENGIDIPNANTLIIYDADYLGLSQLYQLRGRVGRSDRQAYAYLIYKENKIVTEIAYKRLTSIMENSELGSGFKIAMADLEIRGAGNVLGREQHGHMQKVGYDMYVKLLSEAVAELKNEPIPRTMVNTTVDIDLDAFADENYIADSESRMVFYQKMANVSSLKEKNDLLTELTEIYGKPPQEVVNLLTIVTIKLLAFKAGINDLTLRKGTARLNFETKDSLMRQEVFESISKRSENCVLDNKTAALTLKCGKITDEKATGVLEEFLTEIALTQ
ncbi:MAG TPA: transcription-repair coupling factor [Clostridia bacterium]|nr:transcription-repair coupling factor [Clostridia bacterium]